MSKDISKTFTETKTISVSEYDIKRCSRNCLYCHKSNGIYRCYLRSGERNGMYDWEEIEGFEGYKDIDDDNYKTADTYGFKRTDYCLKTFGEQLFKTENEE